MTEKDPSEKKLSKANTKQEMLDAYSSLLQQLKEKDKTDVKPQVEQEKKKNKEIIDKADSLSSEGVFQEITTLKVEMGKVLSQLTDKVESKMRVSLLYIGILAFSSICYAGTYYVSPDGTAPWNECVNINTPCSGKTAMENAIAGDIVYFRGGTYDPSSGPVQRWLDEQPQFRYAIPVWSPKNSGDEVNPIIFIAYPGETPIILDVPLFGSAFGAYRSNYIIWDGFKAAIVNDDPLNNDTHYVSTLFEFVESTHCVVRNSDFQGTKFGRGTNNSLIAIMYSHYIVIQNNKIHDNNGYKNTDAPYYYSAPVNTNGIIIFNSNNVTIRNNDIYNNYLGIWSKDSEHDDIFYNNHIWGVNDDYTRCNAGIQIRASALIEGPATGIKVYQNIIHNCASGIKTDANANPTNPVLTAPGIYNNTIVGNDSYYNNAGITVDIHARDAEVFNNIVVGLPIQLNYSTTTSLVVSYSDYNDFKSTSTIKRWKKGVTECTKGTVLPNYLIDKISFI